MGEAEVPKVFQTFFKSGKYREFAIKRVLSKKQLKNSGITALPALPVSICHSDLIEI